MAWRFVNRSEIVFLGGLAPDEMGNLETVLGVLPLGSFWPQGATPTQVSTGWCFWRGSQVFETVGSSR
ncbi:hypothetical protein FEF26_14165 [Nesterenkonia salmonea]|uniref:Uncharacterized protein n=1 Tax=Nesterenkonia salmonea TaxID=1804987 RepID=A0A5R9B7B5_9MICC|nr:hypothetical protein FEF26_14165 [Nesterenkonia salmonea]